MRSEPNLPARQGHKRVETLLPPAAERGNSPPAEVQRKTPRPLGAYCRRNSCPPHNQCRKKAAARIERTR